MRVQLEVVSRRVTTMWTGSVKQGDIVWVADEKAARHLLEHGICKFIDWKEKPAAPAEVAQEPAPKSAAAQTAGRLTDLQSSNRSWLDVLSSASAAALVLPKRI